MTNRPRLGFKIDDPAAMEVGDLPPLGLHPGQFIRDVLLPEFGLDISKLARLLGVNRANLSQVLSGQRDVSRDLAYRLGALMNDHVADLLISWQHNWDLEAERPRRDAFRAEIARLDPVAAG